MAQAIRWRRRLSNWVTNGALALLLLFALLPILWMILTSLKTPLQLIARPPVIFFKPTLQSYIDLFSRAGFLARNFWNSVLIASSTALLSLFLGSLASFAFSRFRFAGARLLLFITLLTRTLPPIVAIIPLFLAMRKWGLVDTHLGLILIYTALNLPFAIWMLRSFFDAVPVDIEESAMIDGCSRLQAYARVTLPLSLPGLVATAIFLFVLAWNEFIFALIFSSVNAKTMPVVIVETIVEYKIYWADMAAIGTILVLPILVFSFIVQKHLVQGLTTGAIK